MIKNKNVLTYYMCFILVLLNIGCSTTGKNIQNSNKDVQFIKSIKLQKDSEFLYKEKKSNLIEEDRNLILTDNNINSDYIDEPNSQLPIHYKSALIWSLIMIPISSIIFSFLRKINII